MRIAFIALAVGIIAACSDTDDKPKTILEVTTDTLTRTDTLTKIDTVKVPVVDTVKVPVVDTVKVPVDDDSTRHHHS